MGMMGMMGEKGGKGAKEREYNVGCPHGPSLREG